ncbi:MAG: hypothetical protein AB1668_07205 [Nanoarchaeota archaeon]
MVVAMMVVAMKKKNKKDKIDRRFLYLGIWGVVFVILVVLGFSLKENLVGTSGTTGTTGASAYVKYYGVSNYPLNSQAGKIQTYVKLTQPELGNLKTAGGVISVANSITQAADFANGIVSIYQGSPPVPIPTGALDVVISAANYAAGYFSSETKCLSQIGSKYGSQKEVEFVLVSQLAYGQCSYYPEWLYAYVRHSYYTKDGKHICSQEGSKLFSIEMGTGQTSSSTFGC